MLKKVKQKLYKSKREFKDDLDLIWSNCYTYNATEVLAALFATFNSTDIPNRTTHFGNASSASNSRETAS